MKRNLLFLVVLFLLPFMMAAGTSPWAELTLIPPSAITSKVDLDVRLGIRNTGAAPAEYDVSLYLDKVNAKSLICRESCRLMPDSAGCVRHILPTASLSGSHRIIAVVKDGKGKKMTRTKDIEIIGSPIRSTRLIDGAWAGIYHWSETEGKNWNRDIRNLSEAQWREMVRSMHKIGMDIIVIQETFRNEVYCRDSLTLDAYEGKAFYPSNLYPGRMDIASTDPLEAILSEADKHGMNVMMGVGMFAWFDFSDESLAWHKKVANELWDKYGHHPSFYGFYVSEESGGGLDNWEATPEKRQKRKRDIVNFFKEFKRYCNTLAPGKPVMLATNSMEVPNGVDTYPELLQNLDILCPFGFARMPQGDISGRQAANILQRLCDENGSHLWFDLEAFRFNSDQSLSPKPVQEIVRDLNMFDNFEKVLCYQYPGVFNDPEMSVRVGEESTLDLYNGYKAYRDKVLDEIESGEVARAYAVKPVSGTWINLPYQDVRNKYMNPLHVDCTSDAFWTQKINELADMGMEYVIIMAVANEQKAYYPSEFMPHVYRAGQKSPVCAIMDVADKRGMKVFMSTGWAVDQDDNLADPRIKGLQEKIMNETAALYGKRKSFYGWYLPVEDQIVPYFSDRSIESVNALAAKARALTPGAKVLISPYGVVQADIYSDKFAEQVKKLDVDIVAYQDGIGCVPIPQPIPETERRLERLGKIHGDATSDFWVNVESFTWEREVNSRKSALLPCAFPRYLSQIVGASKAGASNIVSFAIYGMMDLPESTMPIGQPGEAIGFYCDFDQWRRGEGRWPLLEATFKGAVEHDAVGKDVRFVSQPSASYAGGNLTDGAFADEDYQNAKWIGFDNSDMECVIDMGKAVPVEEVSARFLQYRPASVSLPSDFIILLSDDGVKYRLVASHPVEKSPNDLHDAWIDVAQCPIERQQARYVKVVAKNRNGWLFCDEILINPKY